MADHEEWSSPANDAFAISLHQPGAASSEAFATFHPKFTYPIFGDSETIFGYKDLEVELQYSCLDLYPNLKVSYSKKFKSVGKTHATDINEALEDHLPEYAFESEQKFESHFSNADNASFTPPGERVSEYESRGKKFEIWAANLTSQELKETLSRIQILVSMFIEGGTPISFDDPEWSLQRWTVYLVYEKLSSSTCPYSFVGYSTAYQYYFYRLPDRTTRYERYQPNSKFDFAFPMNDVLSLPARQRISQFLILPPYQGQGHGKKLYSALYNLYAADPLIEEITVEDPNEAFDDLRDYCDFNHLTKEGAFEAIKINTSLQIPSRGFIKGRIVDEAVLEKIRKKYKLAPRQFLRLVEMYLLSKIPRKIRNAYENEGYAPLRLSESEKGQQKEYELWQLWVKTRIYKRNIDQLAQLDKPERLEKLDATLLDLQEDYVRILQAISQSEGETTKLALGKRKGGLDDEMAAGSSSGSFDPPSKKARTSPDDAE